jgi:hypothetical protein
MFLGNIEEDIEIFLSPAEKWVQSQLNFRAQQYTTLGTKRLYIGILQVTIKFFKNYKFSLVFTHK